MLREGRLMLGAVLHRKPEHALLRRYVALIKVAEPPGPLALPWGTTKLGCILEPLGGTSAIGRRTKLAAALAEASSSVDIPHGRLRIVKALLGDILALPLRVIARLWYR